MCKINLKKLDPKPRSQEQKAPITFNAANIDLGELELLLEGKQSLFLEEPFMTSNGTPLFTPVALNLDADSGYPFPMQQSNLNNNTDSAMSTSSTPATSPAINAAPYAPLMNPAISHDCEEEAEEDNFEFKFMPDQYEEEVTDHMEESEYSLSSSSAPTSPFGGSSDGEGNETFSRKNSSKIPSLLPPCTISINSNSTSPSTTAAAPSNRQPCKRKMLHNPSISEEKRERNRLAAEKYRKKGRDLIVTLERKCDDLSKENTSLSQRNKCLEDELARLREILMKSGYQ
jgi:hypothetical protein